MRVCARAMCGFRPIRRSRDEEEEERRQGGGENREGGKKRSRTRRRKIVREVCGLLLRWNECTGVRDDTLYIEAPLTAHPP